MTRTLRLALALAAALTLLTLTAGPAVAGLNGVINAAEYPEGGEGRITRLN